MDPNEGLIADFVDAVRDDWPPEITIAEGVDTVWVVTAAYESADRGEPVRSRTDWASYHSRTTPIAADRSASSSSYSAGASV